MKTEWSIDLTKYAAKQEIKYKRYFIPEAREKLDIPF